MGTHFDLVITANNTSRSAEFRLLVGQGAQEEPASPMTTATLADLPNQLQAAVRSGDRARARMTWRARFSGNGC